MLRHGSSTIRSTATCPSIFGWFAARCDIYYIYYIYNIYYIYIILYILYIYINLGISNGNSSDFRKWYKTCGVLCQCWKSSFWLRLWGGVDQQHSATFGANLVDELGTSTLNREISSATQMETAQALYIYIYISEVSTVSTTVFLLDGSRPHCVLLEAFLANSIW